MSERSSVTAASLSPASSPTPGAALFTRDGPYFVPTDRARGPWSPDTLHGSPVAALIAHCVERHIELRSESQAPHSADAVAELRIARQTIDLFRPVPYGQLSVEIEPIRQGRRLAVYQTQVSCDGKLLTQATTLCVRAAAEYGSVGAEHNAAPPPPPAEATAARVERAGNRWVSYPGTLEMRHITPPGGDEAPVVWIRADAPVVADEGLSPSVRAAGIADFVSPFANMQPGRSGYVNADITLQLHRPPQGEWHYLRIISRGAADGIATAQAILGDQSGAYGGCSAVSLINL